MEQDHLAALGRLGARRERLRRQLAEVEDELRDAITAALHDDCLPIEVARKSTYSTTQVRNIARAAGLPPAPRGRKGKAS